MRLEIVKLMAAVFKCFEGCDTEEGVHLCRMASEGEVRTSMSGRERGCTGKNFPT